MFRKDLTTGETLLVSTSSSGTQGDGGSYSPSISPDGRYMAFESLATNLVEGDTNGTVDVFRKDLTTGETLLVSTSSSGAQGDGLSLSNPSTPSISSDGRYVAFYSFAPNLVEGDTNGNWDVFRKEVTAPTPAPTVTTITPTYGVENAVVNVTNLAGTGFMTGATVRIEKTGTTVNATDVNVVSATKITCKFNLSGAPLGKYDVVVRNTAAQEAKLTQGFSVTNICGGGAAISLSIFGIMMGLMSLAGSAGLRRRLKRKK